jgi:PAS domain S-box-containing protein
LFWYERKPVLTFDDSPTEAESFFNELADFAPVMIWRASTDAACNWFNKPWLDFVGRAMAQEVGNGWTENIHPDDFDQCLDIYLSSFGARRPFTMSYRLKRSDGKYRELLDTGAPFYRRGAFAGYFGSCVDVTDVRAMEAQLHQTQKMEAIGQLTGGVAHDFNNLLTVIVGSVELLRRPDLSDALRNRYIDAIEDTAQRAVKLTAQLLAFSRRQTLTAETFDIADSIDKVAGIVRALTGSRIELEVVRPDVALRVNADRSQFDTAIVNLAINARDAMDGEGKLVITSGVASGMPPRQGQEAVSGEFVTVAIADTGCGIAEDDLRRIFEPFFTTKGVGRGTGLGLSQVIGFAQQSGGDILVESVVGGGATFTLYLPRSDGAALFSGDTEAPAQRVDGHGVCVLIVEDDAEVGNFAAGALRELGYDSVLVKDARQALDELSKDCGRFHVVFSDVVMPGMSGLELGDRIRLEHPDIAVILASGYSHIVAQNAQHGFELLHKPYSIEQLSRVLQKAVNWEKPLAAAAL